MGGRAEALGVEIYPGFAAAELLYGANGEVVGVATGDMGIGRDGKPKAGFTPGMELHAKYTLIAEGARGSLSKMRSASSTSRRSRSAEVRHRHQGAVAGRARCSGRGCRALAGLAARSRRSGGSFMYHFGENLVAIGFVVHLVPESDSVAIRRVPALQDPPADRATFEGGKRLAYGSRAINEGGLQSVPKLIFPGGALVGCAAGFVNVPRIKGSHNAMKPA